MRFYMHLYDEYMNSYHAEVINKHRNQLFQPLTCSLLKFAAFIVGPTTTKMTRLHGVGNFSA